MARVDAYTNAQRRFRSGRVPRQHCGLLRRPKGFGVGLGIQLDPVGTRSRRVLHCLRPRIHEQAHAHTERFGLLDQRPQLVDLRGQVPTMIGGERTRFIRYESALLRTDLLHVLHQAMKRIALDVEFRRGPSA